MSFEALPPAPLPGGWLPVDPREAPEAPRKGAGPTFWHVILGLDLALVAVSLVATLAAYGSLTAGISARELLWGSLVTLAALGIVPLLWGLGTRRERVRGTLLWFHLDRPLQGLGHGLLLALALLAGLLVLGAILTLAGKTDANPAADELLDVVDLPLAFLVSACAGIGEEIMFRGLLQRGFRAVMPAWAAIGLQAALFGLMHASYGNALQLVIPALLGVAFGIVVERKRNLWGPIIAHFLFNFIQLSSKYWLPAAPAG